MIKVPADSFSGEICLPTSQMVLFLLGPSMVFPLCVHLGGERQGDRAVSLFIRTLIPSDQGSIL